MQAYCTFNQRTNSTVSNHNQNSVLIPDSIAVVPVQTRCRTLKHVTDSSCTVNSLAAVVGTHILKLCLFSQPVNALRYRRLSSFVAVDYPAGDSRLLEPHSSLADPGLLVGKKSLRGNPVATIVFRFGPL